MLVDLYLKGTASVISLLKKRGACFAVFDEHIGPISVYWKGLDKVIADRVALKAMVGAVALTHQVDEGESIIPIQEEGKSAFVYYFSIPDAKARGGERICTLNFVVDREDGDMLYRFAPVLSEHSKRIVQDIKKHYTYRQPLPQNLINSINSILTIDFDKELLKKSKKSRIMSALKDEEEIW